MRNFLLGAIAVVILIIAIGYIGVVTGTLIPANADAQPGTLERWAARQSLGAAVARRAPTSLPPVAADVATFNEGIKIYGWQLHCMPRCG